MDLPEDYFYDDQISLIDSIVCAGEELFQMLDESSRNDEMMLTAVSEIIKFIDQNMRNLPELIFADNNDRYIKKSLEDTFDDVIQAWSDFFINPADFIVEWNNFKDKWKEYESVITKLMDNDRTIFLSMN